MPLTSSSQNSLASFDEEGIGYALMGGLRRGCGGEGYRILDCGLFVDFQIRDLFKMAVKRENRKVMFNGNRCN